MPCRQVETSFFSIVVMGPCLRWIQPPRVSSARSVVLEPLPRRIVSPQALPHRIPLLVVADLFLVVFHRIERTRLDLLVYLSPTRVWSSLLHVLSTTSSSPTTLSSSSPAAAAIPVAAGLPKPLHGPSLRRLHRIDLEPHRIEPSPSLPAHCPSPPTVVFLYVRLHHRQHPSSTSIHLSDGGEQSRK